MSASVVSFPPRTPAGTATGARAFARERARRVAVRLFWLLYGLYLVEGVLRKWVWPGAAHILFFLRDPVVLLLYAWCLSHRLVLGGFWWRVWAASAIVTSLAGFLPFAASGADPIGWILGVRTYWLYLPLAFVLPAIMSRRDLFRFVRFHLVLAVPYAALVWYQYNVGPDHWINHSYTGDEGLALVVQDVVRPYGIFTYSFQNVIFVATLFGIFLASWTWRGPERRSAFVTLAGAAATLVSVLLTGSRSIYFFLAAMIAAASIAALAARGSARWRGFGTAIGSVGLAALLVATVLTDAWEHILERQQTAAAAEGSTFARALRQATAFLDSLDQASPFGAGIGAGTSTVVRVLDLPIFVFGENELERVVYELGPLLGLASVILRAAFAFWLLLAAVRAGRRGDLGAAPMAGLAAILLQNGPVTYTTIIGYQTWLVVGLTLAFIQGTTSSAPEPRGTQRHRSVSNYDVGKFLSITASVGTARRLGVRQGGSSTIR